MNPVSKMDGVLTVEPWKKQYKRYEIPYKYVLSFVLIGYSWKWVLLRDAFEEHDSTNWIGSILIRGTVVDTISCAYDPGKCVMIFDPYPSPGKYGPIRKIYFGNSIEELIAEHFDELL